MVQSHNFELHAGCLTTIHSVCPEIHRPYGGRHFYSRAMPSVKLLRRKADIIINFLIYYLPI